MWVVQCLQLLGNLDLTIKTTLGAIVATFRWCFGCRGSDWAPNVDSVALENAQCGAEGQGVPSGNVDETVVPCEHVHCIENAQQTVRCAGGCQGSCVPLAQMFSSTNLCIITCPHLSTLLCALLHLSVLSGTHLCSSALVGTLLCLSVLFRAPTLCFATFLPFSLLSPCLF